MNMPGWTRIDETMPTEGELVLVLMINGVYNIASWSREVNEYEEEEVDLSELDPNTVDWFDQHGDFMDEPPMHWHPLPTPPDE